MHRKLDGVHEFNWLDGPSIKHGDRFILVAKGTNNKWTYNLTNRLMVDLQTIIAITFMTYIVDLDAYECHVGDEKVFNKFINES